MAAECIHRPKEYRHDDQHNDHQDGHVGGFLPGGPAHLAQFTDRFAVITDSEVRFLAFLFSTGFESFF